jgi:hypothetical protein
LHESNAHFGFVTKLRVITGVISISNNSVIYDTITAIFIIHSLLLLVLLLLHWRKLLLEIILLLRVAGGTTTTTALLLHTLFSFQMR